MKRHTKETIEQMTAYIMVSMVLAFSSMAILAALFAVDIFAEITPVIAGAFLRLSILFFAICVLRSRLEMVSG